MALAFGLVTVLYAGLAVATIGVTAGSRSRVPLADIVSVGFGHIGRSATAVLAVALTMGTMNVYYGGAAKLAASLAQDGALPRWLAGDAHRSVPRRPLVLIALISVTLIAGLVAGFSSTEELVRATSACFIAVYVLAIGSAIRILRGRIRIAAYLALILTLALGVFSAQYLAVPAVVAAGAFLLRRSLAQPPSYAHARARDAAPDPLD
jgi:amino acid efflux transporter